MGQRYPYYPGGQPVIPNMSALPLFPVYSGVSPYGIPQATGNGGTASAPPSGTGNGAASQQPAPEKTGDTLELLPSPKEAALGALITVPTVMGLQKLMGDPQGKMGMILPGVQKLESLPGISHVNNAIDKHVLTLVQRKNTPTWLKNWLNEMWMPLATQGGKDSVEQAVRLMEKARLSKTLEMIHRGVDSQKDSARDIREVYGKLLTKTPGNDGRPPVNFLDPKNIEKIAEKGFNPALEELNIQRELLRKMPASKPDVQKKLLRTLDNLYERAHGIHIHYGEPYRAQAELMARLSRDGVGPLGRTAVSGMQYIQRIFNGETMMASSSQEAGKEVVEAGLKGTVKQGWKKSTALAMPFIGPMFMGAITFGQSFKSAKKAQSGEKTKTFFHDFIGAGLFSFLGWEVGRKVLNAAGFGEKVFGRFAASRLPGIMASIPIIGGITLGGFATELLATFAFGGVFKKGGEMLSHAIFGTPSKESLEGDKKKGSEKNAASGNQQPGVPASMPVQASNGMGLPPGMLPTLAVAPEMAGYIRRHQAAPGPKAPRFSLSPDEIRRNVIPPAKPHPTRFGTDDAFGLDI